MSHLVQVPSGIVSHAEGHCGRQFVGIDGGKLARPGRALCFGRRFTFGTDKDPVEDQRDAYKYRDEAYDPDAAKYIGGKRKGCR